jgi:hypothetical protein
METAEEREQAFRSDLKALLDKHSAEIEVTDDDKPYGLHSGIVIVSMESSFHDGECIKEFCSFEL